MPWVATISMQKVAAARVGGIGPAETARGTLCASVGLPAAACGSGREWRIGSRRLGIGRDVTDRLPSARETCETLVFG